jgi:hypothetical protein
MQPSLDAVSKDSIAETHSDAITTITGVLARFSGCKQDVLATSVWSASMHGLAITPLTGVTAHGRRFFIAPPSCRSNRSFVDSRRS